MRLNPVPLIVALLGLGAAPPAPAASTGSEPVANIRAAALATVPDRTAAGVRVEALLDDTLRLPACTESLQAHAGALGTAEVFCPPANWRLHVPLRITRVQPVVVLARTVAAGEALGADVLRVELRDTGRLAVASLADPAVANGQVARRALAAGAILSPQDVVSPRTIRRGDSVTLVAKRGGLEVRATGRALVAGGPAERITVENLATRRTVQGVLQENGEVLVQ